MCFYIADEAPTKDPVSILVLIVIDFLDSDEVSVLELDCIAGFDKDTTMDPKSFMSDTLDQVGAVTLLDRYLQLEILV